MCLYKSRYALVLALGRNNIFATAITDLKGTIDTAQWERCHKLLGNESKSGLQSMFQCIWLVLCLV